MKGSEALEHGKPKPRLAAGSCPEAETADSRAV